MNVDMMGRPEMEEEHGTIQTPPEPETDQNAEQAGQSSGSNPLDDHAPRTKRTKPLWVQATALELCCALIGGVSAIGAFSILGKNASSTATNSTTTILSGSRETTVLTSEVDTNEEMTAAQVYAQNVNSTVGITTTTTTNHFGYETTSAASGSGFILTSDGYILTNYHVIEDSSEITVSTYDGNSYDAELVGYVESSDIAVLKIDESPWGYYGGYGYGDSSEDSSESSGTTL